MEENQRKNSSNSKKTTAITIAICLVIVIIAIVISVLALNGNFQDKKENTEPKSIEDENVVEVTETPKTEEPDEVKEIQLTDNQLLEIQEYIENGKVKFLTSEFTKPEEADIYLQLQYGYDPELKVEEISLEEEVAYFSKQNISEDFLNEHTIEEYIEETRNIMGDPLKKFSKTNLDAYIKNNLGVATSDLDLSFLTYIEEFDAYYMERASDAFIKNIAVLSGKINKDGLYEVKYRSTYAYTWIVTLRKEENRFIFVSNINNLSEKIAEIRKTKGLIVKEGQYNNALDYKMHYKDNALYYVEVYSESDTHYAPEQIYYYENNQCIACTTNVVGLEEYYEFDTLGNKLYDTFKAN